MAILLAIVYFFYHPFIVSTIDNAYRNLFFDETYRYDVPLRSRSDKGIKVSLDIDVNGNKENNEWFVRSHTYLAGYFLYYSEEFSTLATDWIHNKFQSGDWFLYNIDSKAITYWNEKEGVATEYHFDSDCPASQPQIKLSVSIKEVEGKYNYIKADTAKYDISQYNSVLVYKKLYEDIKDTYKTDFDSLKIYENSSLTILPKEYWSQFSELRKVFERIHSNSIITRDVDPFIIEKVRKSMSQDWELFNRAKCGEVTFGGKVIGERALGKKQNGQWTIDWNRQGAKTYFYKKSIPYSAFVESKQHLEKFEIELDGEVFICPPNEQFIIYMPKNGTIYYSAYGNDTYFVPDFID
ncbi:hypothetical protein [Pseudodesulfovibrio sp. zrk46]|uniref:hypothetical protein n=1 Tax=Pseudodesulfovibrio sp. zrk46 TaxID=2725288 RepID=UPI001449EEFD|nr:hypothetical protein [Pseudodesulfovibrio sp. zrk46]QJB56400.1 hypothetical protein HFN16_08225 [Pseudodesulfovibrio sp. zrk46]